MKKYRGWTFEYTGHGYRLVRESPYKGKTIEKRATSIERGKNIVDNIELSIMLGLDIKH